MRSSIDLYDPGFLDIAMSNDIAGRSHKKKNKNKNEQEKLLLYQREKTGGLRNE